LVVRDRGRGEASADGSRNLEQLRPLDGRLRVRGRWAGVAPASAPPCLQRRDRTSQEPELPLEIPFVERAQAVDDLLEAGLLDHDLDWLSPAVAERRLARRREEHRDVAAPQIRALRGDDPGEPRRR